MLDVEVHADVRRRRRH